jgi:hypothetical protein
VIRPSPVKFVLLIALGSILVHGAFGWAWTIAPAIVFGVWIGRGAWYCGMAGVALGWLVLTLASLLAAPGASLRMLSAVGGVFGGMPGVVIFILTILIGAILGLLGGVIGSSIGSLYHSYTRKHSGMTAA